MSKKNLYHVQPVDLSTMEVEADSLEVIDCGVEFSLDGEVVFFAPHINTKYITKKDCSVVVKHKR